MARLTRYTQKLFGSTATTGRIAEFGSLQAGTPTTYSGATVTPADIQALGNFLQGWDGAVIGNNSPAIQDLTALDYLWGYQLSYILQVGIPEYDSGTTYYTDNIVAYSGSLYISAIDNNTGNTPSSSPSDWSVFVSARKAPTFQLFGAGASGSYTPPSNPSPLYIEVLLIGAGGGGGGSGTSGETAGGAGGTTSFNSTAVTLEAGGGSGGGATGGDPGAGGTTTIGGTNPPLLGSVPSNGGYGGNLSGGIAGSVSAGGLGGSSYFGGNGSALNSTGVGTAGQTGGGGGGAISSIDSAGGAGGGGGATVIAFIESPTSGTYTYSVGSGGSGGTAGTSGHIGGAGGGGTIFVREYYQ